VLRELAHVVARPLLIVFERSWLSEEGSGAGKKTNVIHIYKKGKQGDLGIRTRSNGHKLKHMKFHLNAGKHCEGHQTLDQVALRGCEVSVCGDLQNPTGHGPG